MPYSGPDDPKLPANVKKLSAAKRRQWVGAWNGSYSACTSKGKKDCESSAFAIANAAVQKGEPVSLAPNPDSLFGRVLGALLGKGSPMVATKEQSLSTQNRAVADALERRYPYTDRDYESNAWFVDAFAESQRVIFRRFGRLWRLNYTADESGYVTLASEDPAEVEIAYVDKPTAKAFTVFKDASTGELRWLSIVSNQFQDRQGDTIEEAAHLEFVAAVEKGQTPYPDLWLWHIPGSKIGVADKAFYADSFLVVSGTFLPEAKAIGETLAETPNLGMSHGFFCLKNHDTIGWYRTFEVSVLPITAAANQWTAFEAFAQEVKAMALTQDQKDWLAKVAGETRANEIAAALPNAAEQLKALGIAHKAAEPAALPVVAAPLNATPAVVGAVPAVAPAVVPTAAVVPPAPAAVAAEGSAPSDLELVTAGLKAVNDSIDGRIAAALSPVAALLAEQVKQSAALLATVTELKKSDDLKIAERMAPRGIVPVVPASQAASNIATQTETEALAKAAGQNQDWLADQVTKVVKIGMGG